MTRISIKSKHYSILLLLLILHIRDPGYWESTDSLVQTARLGLIAVWRKLLKSWRQLISMHCIARYSRPLSTHAYIPRLILVLPAFCTSFQLLKNNLQAYKDLLTHSQWIYRIGSVNFHFLMTRIPMSMDRTCKNRNRKTPSPTKALHIGQRLRHSGHRI